MKQSVLLRFPSQYDLWGYIVAIRLASFELNLAAHLLYCECDDQQLELALSAYGAKQDSGLQNDSLTPAHEQGSPQPEAKG